MSETTPGPTPEAIHQVQFNWGAIELSDAVTDRMGLVPVDGLQPPKPDTTHPPITIRMVTVGELRRDHELARYSDVPIERQNPFAVVSAEPDSDGHGQQYGWSFDAVIGERPIRIVQEGTEQVRGVVLDFMQKQLVKQLLPSLSTLLGEQIAVDAITSERVWMRRLLASWVVAGSVALAGSSMEHDSAWWAKGAVGFAVLTGLAKLYHSGRLIHGFGQRVQDAAGPTASNLTRKIARDFGASFKIQMAEQPGSATTDEATSS